MLLREEHESNGLGGRWCRKQRRGGVGGGGGEVLSKRRIRKERK